jgi:hypothetical protein
MLAGILKVYRFFELFEQKFSDFRLSAFLFHLIAFRLFILDMCSSKIPLFSYLQNTTILDQLLEDAT